MLIRGAGVDSVLHTIRIDAITQAGASGIFVEVKWLLLGILFGRCGVRDAS